MQAHCTIRLVCFQVLRRAAANFCLYSPSVLWYHPYDKRKELPAFIYTGSIGEFRYRFDGDKDAGILHTAVYSNVCYELAQDKEERDFTWDEAGVETLKAWLQEKYEAYCTAQK